MLFASLLFLALPLLAEDSAWQTACFSGLNDSVSPALIGDCEAQSALNVETNLGGNAIKRRAGYSVSASLTIATSPVSGTHHYRDSSGNNVDIACHDRMCARSINGNAYSVFLTTAGGTGALPVRWSFADINGNLYLANDRRDKVGKWDGTTFTSPPGFPLGSILALTQDRMAIGDISGNINRVYYSSSGAVENWTVGSNNDDPYYDDLGSPGERITGLIHHRGVFYVFKSRSITGCNLGTQFTTTCSILSSVIGTNDPASVVAAGSDLYFKGNDGHFWKLSGGGSGYNLGPGQLDQISRKIYTLLSSQSQGAQRDNVQTTKSDWESGVETPTGTWDTASVNGSIFPSSFTIFHSSASDFTGTLLNVSTGYSGSVCFVSHTTQSFINAGAESNDSTNWPAYSDWIPAVDPGFGPVYGSYIWNPNGWAGGDAQTIYFKIQDENSNLLQTNTYTVTQNMNPTAYTIDLRGISHCAIRVYVETTSSGSILRRYQSVPFIRPDELLIVLFDNDRGAGTDVKTAFDIWQGSVYTTSATYTSQVIDTLISTPVFGAIGLDVSSGTNRTINIQARTSASGTGGWSNHVTISTFSATWPTALRYVQYIASFSVTAATEAPATFNSLTIPYATTGYFVTQCIEPDAAISQWGTLSCSETTAGNGSVVYYATSAATCATLPTTDPSDTTKWINAVMTNNADLGIATNTAVKIGFRSLLRASTDQAQIDSCTLSWKSGTPAQPVWGLYDSVQNSVYWTTTIGSSIAYANRLLKYDLNTQGWFPFDLKAQSPFMSGLTMYYGDSGSGKVNRYGGVNTDNGGGIQAHWKTRDIGASEPFQEKDFKKVSLLSKNEGSGTADATWLLSDGKTGTWTVTLSTGAGLNYTRSNYNLPFSSPQNFMNLKLGNDNANEPFEFLGIRVDYFIKPWRVSGP